MKRRLAAIVLAAGRGERMRSDIPKVLHQVCAKPMLSYVVDVVKDLKVDQVVTVLGYKHKDVRTAIPSWVKVAIQKKLQGTADAERRIQIAAGFSWRCADPLGISHY